MTNPSLHGRHLIAGARSGQGPATLRATDPTTGASLAPAFHEATPDEVDAALQAAEAAFEANRARPAADRAALLEAIADAIEALGEALVARVTAETALPAARVQGERARTTGQLRLFAGLVREGSWVEARIDPALPTRKPLPRPDLRRMLVPLGPVAVFGASNFPLAFSVAGGDTASALAAGCPVVVKAHPAHPGTSEMVGTAVAEAVAACGFHPGTFSLLHAAAPARSLDLVRHPLTRAVGFTGSLQAGRALFDAAAARPDPIPVYAEMGSVNPVFVLPGALAEGAEAIADGFVQSLTLGAGQFCTNPGLVFGVRSPALDAFLDHVAGALGRTEGFTLLHSGIRTGYEAGLARWEAAGAAPRCRGGGEVAAALYTTDAATFAARPALHDEVFGPAALVVQAGDADALLAAGRALGGNLTATLHATTADLEAFAPLVRVLERRVGRLLVGGFPTGVEVGHAMHHGGPYPATTDVRTTSVGTAAIARFARPLCYQNAPPALLPPELADANPRGLWRLVDGVLTRAPL